MRSLNYIAAAALIASSMAAPAMARDYCDTHRCDRGPVEGAVDAGASVAGAAIGTAGAIATAPFRGPRDSYAYDRDGGSACQPGAWYRGEDGRRHRC